MATVREGELHQGENVSGAPRWHFLFENRFVKAQTLQVIWIDLSHTRLYHDISLPPKPLHSLATSSIPGAGMRARTVEGESRRVENASGVSQWNLLFESRFVQPQTF